MLTAGLDPATLDALLDPRPPGKLTWLGWLGNAPQSPAPRSVTKLIDRVEHVRAIGVARTRADTLPGQVLERLADEAARITTQHLGELNPLRRHATLAAAAIAHEAALRKCTNRASRHSPS